MPDAVESLYCQALSHHQSGNLQQPDALYRQILPLAPEFAAAHDTLALAYQHLGDCPTSIAHFQRATQLSPQTADFHAHLAHALRESGNLDDSIAVAHQALLLEANNVAALTTIASS